MCPSQEGTHTSLLYWCWAWFSKTCNCKLLKSVWHWMCQAWLSGHVPCCSTLENHLWSSHLFSGIFLWLAWCSKMWTKSCVTPELFKKPANSWSPFPSGTSQTVSQREDMSSACTGVTCEIKEQLMTVGLKYDRWRKQNFFSIQHICAEICCHLSDRVWTCHIPHHRYHLGPVAKPLSPYPMLWNVDKGSILRVELSLRIKRTSNCSIHCVVLDTWQASRAISMIRSV